jgi:hypothetical protein
MNSHCGVSGSIPVSYEICGGRNYTGIDFFFCFPLLIFIPPLLRTHSLLLPEAYDSPDQAAHYHILSLYVWDFIFDPALAWLQNEGISFSTINVVNMVDILAKFVSLLVIMRLT